MFGPNGVPHDLHHREDRYRALVRGIRAAFRRLGVPKEWRVVTMTGSGTLAVQALLSTLDAKVVVHGPDAEFTKRLRAFGSLAPQSGPEVDAWVQYETSAARVVEAPPVRRGVIRVADCVSAFPYYVPPPDCDAWVTVSGKQIGAMTGVGVVAIGPRAEARVWEDMSKDCGAYTDLRRWLRAEDRDEHPHTPAIGVVSDLLYRLDRLDPASLRRHVDANRQALTSVLGPAIEGEGPVANIRQGVLPAELVQKWGLYARHGAPQVFLWNCPPRDFENFLGEVAQCRAT